LARPSPLIWTLVGLQGDPAALPSDLSK